MKTVKGDLIKMALNNDFDVIIHGCNCFNTMGSGIALSIKQMFPEAETADSRTIKGDFNKLGTISYIIVKLPDRKDLVIVNAYTQYTYDAKSKPFNLDALKSSFRQIRTLFHEYKIGYPAIGAGLGGGNWDEISASIDEIFHGLDHTYVEFDG